MDNLIQKRRLSISSDHRGFVSHYLTNYTPIRILGSGGFGVVIESKNILDETNYAIKIVELPSDEEEKAKVMREVKNMAKLEHNFIVTYYSTWLEYPTEKGWLNNLISTYKLEGSISNPSQSEESITDENETYLCIKMALCKKECLQTWLDNNVDYRDIQKALQIFRDILRGVQYIHSKDMIHR